MEPLDLWDNRERPVHRDHQDLRRQLLQFCMAHLQGNHGLQEYHYQT